MFQAVGFAGNQPFNDWFSCDTTQRHPLGLMLNAVDPFWRGGTFMYITSSTTIVKGAICAWEENMVAVACPSTALQGFPLGILMAPLITGQFGWLQLAGYAPVTATNTIAADTAFAIVAAGSAGTLAAGKQVVGARNRKASAATLAKTNTQTQNGSAKIVTSTNYDGWFLGMALSGTGIPASTVIARLDPDGRTVYTGSAVGTVGDKNSTASGGVTVTGTWTNFIGPVFNYPYAQGAIT